MDMKYKRLAFLICVSILSAAGSLSAQTRQNIDTDILALRNNVLPGFRWHYDDYLQYAPAAVMLGIKAFDPAGGATSWSRMLVADAFSIASMALVVNGMKYSFDRLRPDGSAYNSFPSGHTATAFMTATMLHKEYGWKSPWYSIGGYTAAAITGVSRIMNNRHYLTDVVAGAAIGIGSVHLGYWLSSLIFKDKGNCMKFSKPVFHYDFSSKHYVAEMVFGRRFIIGAEGRKDMGALPVRGALAGVQTDIPVIAGVGVTARLSASSMIYRSNAVSTLYAAGVGGFWNYNFARILELQLKAMGGYAWFENRAGVDLTAGMGLSVITDNNFKVKAFADFESISLSSSEPWLNSLVAGFGTAWFW